MRLLSNAKKRKRADLSEIIYAGVEDNENDDIITKAGKAFELYLQHTIDSKIFKDPNFQPLKRLFFGVHNGQEILVHHSYIYHFSSAGNIFTKKRAMLGPELLDKLIFSHSNN